jgi:hypothetical protein
MRRRHLAALAAVSLSLSACGSGSPALTKDQAEQVLARYQSVNNQANSNLDGGLLSTVETGAQLDMDRAGYALRKANHDHYSAFSYTASTFYIPRQHGYPRWFAVDATSGKTRHALLFVEEKSGGPFLLAADPFPTTALSGIALDKDGYAKAVSPRDSSTELTPERIAGEHAAALTTGSTGMAPGPFTSDSRNALVKVQSGLSDRGVTLTADFQPDKQRVFALRTIDGGALVWYVLRQTERYDMSSPGTVGDHGDLAGLITGKIGHRLDTTALIQYLATVPKHGSPQVFGSYRKAVQATTS